MTWLICALAIVAAVGIYGGAISRRWQTAEGWRLAGALVAAAGLTLVVLAVQNGLLPRWLPHGMQRLHPGGLGAGVAAMLVVGVTEELAKGLAVLIMARPRHGPREMALLGAAAGLGLSLVEIFLHVGSGGPGRLAAAALRVGVVTMLHCAWGAAGGYLMGELRRRGRRWPVAALSVPAGVHALYDLMVLFVINGLQTGWAAAGLAGSVAVAAMQWGALLAGPSAPALPVERAEPA